MSSEAYQRGKKYFKHSPSNYKNPYKPNTQDWNDFDRGFYQAMRQSSYSPPPNNNHDDSLLYYRTVNGKRERIKTMAEEEIERSAEAYRNRRGE